MLTLHYSHKYYTILVTTLCIFSSISAQIPSNLSKFRSCLNHLGIGESPLVTPSTSGSVYNYTFLNHQWNLRKSHVYPLGYFLPESTHHVQVAVWCGVDSGIGLIPKSGGHSYEAHSAGDNSSLVMDFRRMNSVKINSKRETARVQPGAVIGSVNSKLVPAGFGIPMGQCHTVGIGGHVLGGGIGYFSHVHGLALDNVLQITVVDAAGVVHIVSRDSNPSLFWGLRGMGSGYIGIVTEFKFKLFKTDPPNLNVTFVKLVYDFGQTAKVVGVWQQWLEWVRREDPKVFSLMQMKRFKSKLFNLDEGIEIHLVHIQDNSKQLKGPELFLKQMYSAWPSVGRKNFTITHPTYYELIIDTGYAPIISDTPATEVDITSLTDKLHRPRYFKVSSFYVKKWMNGSELERIGNLLQKMPSKNILIVWTSERGAIEDVPASGTSYVHRDFPYSISIQYEGSPKADQVSEGMGYIDKFMKETKFIDGGETYQNFVDDDLKSDYLHRYYGSNLKRLLTLKREWDPKNYFRNKQSLPLL